MEHPHLFAADRRQAAASYAPPSLRGDLGREPERMAVLDGTDEGDGVYRGRLDVALDAGQARANSSRAVRGTGPVAGLAGDVRRRQAEQAALFVSLEAAQRARLRALATLKDEAMMSFLHHEASVFQGRERLGLSAARDEPARAPAAPLRLAVDAAAARTVKLRDQYDQAWARLLAECFAALPTSEVVRLREINERVEDSIRAAVRERAGGDGGADAPPGGITNAAAPPMAGSVGPAPGTHSSRSKGQIAPAALDGSDGGGLLLQSHGQGPAWQRRPLRAATIGPVTGSR